MKLCSANDIESMGLCLANHIKNMGLCLRKGLLFLLIELEMFGPVMELGIKNAPCRSHPREKQEDERERQGRKIIR